MENKKKGLKKGKKRVLLMARRSLLMVPAGPAWAFVLVAPHSFPGGLPWQGDAAEHQIVAVACPG